MQQDVRVGCVCVCGGSENPLPIVRCLYKTETSYLFVACVRNIYNVQLRIKM